MQETYVFDGQALLPVPQADVYGIDGEDADLSDLGYVRQDACFPEQLCILWERESDDFLVEIVLNGCTIRTIKIEGFPRLMDFVRLYLHPLVVVQSFGIHTGELQRQPGRVAA
jgi:hypothetical protein